LVENLFDQVPDIAFFIKDHLGRYVVANKTLCQRCGVSNKEEIIGKTADKLFPAPLGTTFAEQDQLVLKTARRIKNRLELHLYDDGKEGWCLTYKEPIFDRNKLIIGVSGISRDLGHFADKSGGLDLVSQVMSYVSQHIREPLRLPDLAAMVGLSVYQLDQRVRAVYNLSAGQLVTRARVDAACHLLAATGKSIPCIAVECGYSDQSSFTRQFKQTTGLTPKTYRERQRG